jgi:hypothetical protein
VARVLCRSGSFTTPRAAVWSFGTVGLEAAARALGAYDARHRRASGVWDMCSTTKAHIADGMSALAQPNVAVFHIVDFHRQQLELGLHASRQLTRRAADHIRRALGPAAIVAIQESGTIIALLPGDRDAAEQTAHGLVASLEATRLTPGSRTLAAPVTVACGLVAFPQAGPPLAWPVPIPVLKTGPAVPVAG